MSEQQFTIPNRPQPQPEQSEEPWLDAAVAAKRYEEQPKNPELSDIEVLVEVTNDGNIVAWARQEEFTLAA